MTKLATGRLGGALAGIGPAPGRRAGLILIARGEFSIAIAGLAVAAGLEPRLATLTVAYVLIMAVIGTIGVRLAPSLAGRRES